MSCSTVPALAPIAPTMVPSNTTGTPPPKMTITMNGAHDMGGTHGFGPIVPEVREPTFHAEWERRVFALTMAAGRPGKWNIDMGRFARENRPPADYLNKSY